MVNLCLTEMHGERLDPFGALSARGAGYVEAGLTRYIRQRTINQEKRHSGHSVPKVPSSQSSFRSAIQELTGKGKVAPENIVVLSPYKYTSEHLMIKDLVEKEELFTATVKGDSGSKVRIGTIQSFKGLESDVVILCGIDGKLPGCSPANLYVGAMRARVMLYVIRQRKARA